MGSASSRLNLIQKKCNEAKNIQQQQSVQSSKGFRRKICPETSSARAKTDAIPPSAFKNSLHNYKNRTDQVEVVVQQDYSVSIRKRVRWLDIKLQEEEDQRRAAKEERCRKQERAESDLFINTSVIDIEKLPLYDFDGNIISSGGTRHDDFVKRQRQNALESCYHPSKSVKNVNKSTQILSLIAERFQGADHDGFSESGRTLALPSYVELVKNNRGIPVIVTKCPIAVNTKLGPVLVRRVQVEESALRELVDVFVLVVFGDNGETNLLDTSFNASSANWMNLIPAARNANEVNCLAVQLEQDIYYVTTRTIPRGGVLRVWYSPYYSRQMGQAPIPDGRTKTLHQWQNIDYPHTTFTNFKVKEMPDGNAADEKSTNYPNTGQTCKVVNNLLPQKSESSDTLNISQCKLTTCVLPDHYGSLWRMSIEELREEMFRYKNGGEFQQEVIITTYYDGIKVKHLEKDRKRFETSLKTTSPDNEEGRGDNRDIKSENLSTSANYVYCWKEPAYVDMEALIMSEIAKNLDLLLLDNAQSKQEGEVKAKGVMKQRINRRTFKEKQNGRYVFKMNTTDVIEKFQDSFHGDLFLNEKVCWEYDPAKWPEHETTACLPKQGEDVGLNSRLDRYKKSSSLSTVLIVNK